MTPDPLNIDYDKSFVMPIRDTWDRATPIAFKVVVYGWDPKDAAIIPGGMDPIRRAIERAGLDTDRYQGLIADIPVRVPPKPRFRWTFPETPKSDWPWPIDGAKLEKGSRVIVRTPGRPVFHGKIISENKDRGAWNIVRDGARWPGTFRKSHCRKEPPAVVPTVVEPPEPVEQEQAAE
jgi:hypothetical protein